MKVSNSVTKVLIRVSKIMFYQVTENDDIPPQYEEISKTFKSDPMSTSFYGSLPDAEFSEEPTSVPTTESFLEKKELVEKATTVTEKVVESTVKTSKTYDEADMDFEKIFKQQSSSHSSNVQQSIQTSKIELTSTFSSSTSEKDASASTVEKSQDKNVSKREDKLWEKPLGNV